MNGVPVLWLGTTLGDAEPSELEQFFDEMGFKVRFEEEFKDNEVHSNIVFSILEDIGKFSLFRLRTCDMKWVDDFDDNNPNVLPSEIREKYL